MQQFVQNELEKLSKIIVDTLPVKQVYLFGSYAKGTQHQNSDLDLYVIIDDDYPEHEIEATYQIQKAIFDAKTMAVDVVVKREKAFLNRKDSPTLDGVVANEGILLYG